MKRIFSVLMLAVIATVTFAFNTPKVDAFAETYGLVAGEWVQGEGSGCTASNALCQFTSSVPITKSSAFSTIAAQYPAPSTGGTFQVDVSGDAALETVTISAISRRP